MVSAGGDFADDDELYEFDGSSSPASSMLPQPQPPLAATTIVFSLVAAAVETAAVVDTAAERAKAPSERRYELPRAHPKMPAQAWADEALEYLEEVLGAATEADVLLDAVIAQPAGLPVTLFLELERARVNATVAKEVPIENPNFEVLQIQHKLVFDVINEELARVQSRYSSVLPQVRASRGSRHHPEIILHFLARVRADLRATLEGLARNVDAAPEALISRATTLARADVKSGALGDELDDVRGVEALIDFIADELAAELEDDLFGGEVNDLS